MKELYSRTGIQFMELNTLFQLCALKKYRPHILDRADILPVKMSDYRASARRAEVERQNSFFH